VTRVHLAHGILERDGRLLLVASRYRNQPEPLWNLPGGRQRPGELLEETVRREFIEEVGLLPQVLALRYVAESFDRDVDVHFTGFIFRVTSVGIPSTSANDAHVVEHDWVAFADLGRRLTVPVVRDPLIAHLTDPSKRYFGFAEAGITIEFLDEA
jgi:8-oxo-dGTP diphosphatase